MPSSWLNVGSLLLLSLLNDQPACHAHLARVMHPVRAGREADAGVRAGVPGHGENTAGRSAYRDGSHADRRYDCTSNSFWIRHSGSTHVRVVPVVSGSHRESLSAPSDHGMWNSLRGRR